MIPLMFALFAGLQAQSVVDAAVKTRGTADLQSIRYTGTGTNNTVRQAFTSGGPWPRFKVTKYVALINYTVPVMRQELVRVDNEYPPRGGGAGPFNPNTGQGGIRPVPGYIVQNLNIDGRTEAGAMNLWLTPHGFLKGALESGDTRVSGGLRAYAAEGIPIITHESHKKYYEQIFRNRGLQRVPVIESMKDKRVLTDGPMSVELHLVRNNFHSEGLRWVRSAGCISDLSSGHS